MLIENFYKDLLKSKDLTKMLLSCGLDLDAVQLIDITDLEPINPYKEVGINRGFKDPNVQQFRVNPAHNLDIESPFDSCLIKWAAMDIEGEQGELYILLHDDPAVPDKSLAIAFVQMSELMDVQVYSLHKDGVVYATTPMGRKNDDQLNGYMIDMMVQCIATLKKCNKKDVNLYITTPPKGKGVKINGKFKDISAKPIYIYTNKAVNVNKAQRYSRGNPVEYCHCWPVRGHWRRLDDPKKRGKNPDGEYVIEGMTWVKPSVRGNKDMPLKQRTYIARESDG